VPSSGGQTAPAGSSLRAQKGCPAHSEDPTTLRCEAAGGLHARAGLSHPSRWKRLFCGLNFCVHIKPGEMDLSCRSRMFLFLRPPFLLSRLSSLNGCCNHRHSTWRENTCNCQCHTTAARQPLPRPFLALGADPLAFTWLTSRKGCARPLACAWKSAFGLCGDIGPIKTTSVGRHCRLPIPGWLALSSSRQTGTL
jgi:hypothetical protein